MSYCRTWIGIFEARGKVNISRVYYSVQRRTALQTGDTQTDAYASMRMDNRRD